MIWFTSDEHYGHTNIIKYCNRPFSSVEEMNAAIIDNLNSKVDKNDQVFHLGDFCLKLFFPYGNNILSQLNGSHSFIKGSHDKGIRADYIQEIKIEDKTIVLCHYAMIVWPKSHYDSWHLYGHSHGKLPSYGLSYDVGVDNNNYFPISYEEIKNKMARLEIGD